MRRSPDSLRRGIVINPAVPVPERLRALRELKPTRRFLEHLLKADIPPRLHAEASKILLSLPRKSAGPEKSPEGPTPISPAPSEHVPVRETELEDCIPNCPAEPVLDFKGRRIVDAEIFDALTLDPNSEEARAWASKWNLVRGPDPEEFSSPPVESPDPKTQPHGWRDALPKRNEDD
jgi:hypothetical protein